MHNTVAVGQTALLTLALARPIGPSHGVVFGWSMTHACGRLWMAVHGLQCLILARFLWVTMKKSIQQQVIMKRASAVGMWQALGNTNRGCVSCRRLDLKAWLRKRTYPYASTPGYECIGHEDTGNHLGNPPTQRTQDAPRRPWTCFMLALPVPGKAHSRGVGWWMGQGTPCFRPFHLPIL